jgi:hypothetical protein
MEIARVTRPTSASATVDVSTIEVPGGTLAWIVALLGVVPAIVTAIANPLMQGITQRDTTALDTARLEFDRQKAAAELYQRALAITDAGQRHKAIQFLLKAGVVPPAGALAALPAADIPHWPTATNPAP